MDTSVFNLHKHVSEYHYDYVTVLDGILPDSLCCSLRDRITAAIDRDEITLVDHDGLGTRDVSDSGGRYFHHVFQGQDVREYLPELIASYYSLLPLIGLITSQEVIVSPHDRSDVNVKVYPPGGGTLGEHYDTNGVTVLLFLTTNEEAPLRLKISRSHPGKDPWIERRSIYARSGSLLIMQGREVLHDCEPTVTEQKITVVFNYYAKGDVWRPEKFDAFVYEGVDPLERDTAVGADG
jgi:hypothetical protein